MANDSGTGVTLIVGLGNPGAQYARTRHNVGFWLVERVGSLKLESRFQADIGTASIAGERVVLMKPQTFMNRSGAAVGAYTHYYKIAPAQVLVVHDELDLAPGVVRLKQGGGHGGHNGLRDISAQIGGDYSRLRIGIGHPGSAEQVTQHVLSNPSPDERISIEQAIDRALERLADIVGGRFDQAMNDLNRRDGDAGRGKTQKE